MPRGKGNVWLNPDGWPVHDDYGMKRGPKVGNRQPPQRSIGKPLDEWMRHEFRTRARRLFRGHETIVDAINDVPGQSISRRTYFNALRGEPISERTRHYLHEYLKHGDFVDPAEKTWEERLLSHGFSEEKARVFGEMLERAAPKKTT